MELDIGHSLCNSDNEQIGLLGVDSYTLFYDTRKYSDDDIRGIVNDANNQSIVDDLTICDYPDIVIMPTKVANSMTKLLLGFKEREVEIL